MSSHSIQALFHRVGLLLQPDNDSDDDYLTTSDDDSSNMTILRLRLMTMIRILGLMTTTTTILKRSVDIRCSDSSLKGMKTGRAELGGPAPAASTGDEQTPSFCP